MQNLMPPVNTPDKLFHDGDPSQGIEGTIVSAEFMNNEQGAIRDAQQELINILVAASMDPDPDKTDQVITALRTLFLDSSSGSGLPVGVPVPWPLSTPPAGWLKCNGATFTSALYPKLAQAYPALKLPDLRGEFLRGWDDGRGVDSGRAIASSQNDAFQDHYHGILTKGAGAGSLWSIADETGLQSSGDTYIGNGTTGGAWNTYKASENSGSPRTAAETRPRNIAFNYIVRAA